MKRKERSRREVRRVLRLVLECYEANKMISKKCPGLKIKPLTKTLEMYDDFDDWVYCREGFEKR